MTKSQESDPTFLCLSLINSFLDVQQSMALRLGRLAGCPLDFSDLCLSVLRQ